MTDDQRELIALILEEVAENGLPGPRDLDVALEAIACAFSPPPVAFAPTEEPVDETAEVLFGEIPKPPVRTALQVDRDALRAGDNLPREGNRLERAPHRALRLRPEGRREARRDRPRRDRRLLPLDGRPYRAALQPGAATRLPEPLRDRTAEVGGPVMAASLRETVARAAYDRLRTEESPTWDQADGLQRMCAFIVFDAALAAIEASGHKIVPVEPTHEMLLAGDRYLYDARWPDALPQHIQRGLFDAMISGALPPTSN